MNAKLWESSQLSNKELLDLVQYEQWQDENFAADYEEWCCEQDKEICWVGNWEVENV